MSWLVRQASASRWRGRWDWLRDLVGRTPASTASPAIAHAICRLGMAPRQIVEAIAAVLDLPPSRADAPDAFTAAHVDGRHLAVLLPALVLHEHPAVRALAVRWLQAPAVAYQIPTSVLESWLGGDGPCADVLAPRLHAEGLALLAPAALHRLADKATRANVRSAARGWLDRLEDGSTVGAGC